MRIPQEPAIADLPSSPSEAYALGFRNGWLDCFGAEVTYDCKRALMIQEMVEDSLVQSNATT